MEANRITIQQHRQFVNSVLSKAGVATEDAKIVAEALLWADLRGRHSNGIVRLMNMTQRLSKGLIHSPAKLHWTELSPSISRLDAGDGLGHVASYHGVQRSIELAKKHGMGMVAVGHSNHYGAAAYYCALAAEAGCVSMNGTNAFPKVAPYGGTTPVLGTNPLAFGCPTGTGIPVLVDLSTSAISGAEVRTVLAEKDRLPGAVAIDEFGNPTNDPSAAAKGCLLPAAGPKGFGLAIMVEVLSGLLAASAIGKEVGSVFKTWDRPVNTGHFFLAIDIARFMPLSDFSRRIDTLIEWIKESPPQHGIDVIRYPGEIRGEHAARYCQEGIPIGEETRQAIAKLQDSFHVQPPWELD